VIEPHPAGARLDVRGDAERAEEPLADEAAVALAAPAQPADRPLDRRGVLGEAALDELPRHRGEGAVRRHEGQGVVAPGVADRRVGLGLRRGVRRGLSGFLSGPRSSFRCHLLVGAPAAASGRAGAQLPRT
jgi:hypothetical protein